MGIIKRLKDIFNKNIECGDELDNHIVVFLKKKKYLYLNKNIIVRDNSACVVAYKGKVADVIMPGKYRIGEESIPDTYERAKIEKYSNKGKKIKRIRANLYYINTNEFKNFEFLSDEPFLIKSHEFGRVKGNLKGTCVVRVIDPKSLIKALLYETGKLDNEEVSRDIGLWIGNKINKKIEKNKVSTNMILFNQEHVQALLNTELEDSFDKIGIFVRDVRLKAVDFNKKCQKKINEYVSSKKRVLPSYKINECMSNSMNTTKINMPVELTVRHSATQTNKNHSNLNNFIVCKMCGSKNSIQAKFCINCGCKLK